MKTDDLKRELEKRHFELGYHALAKALQRGRKITISVEGYDWDGYLYSLTRDPWSVAGMEFRSCGSPRPTPQDDGLSAFSVRLWGPWSDEDGELAADCDLSKLSVETLRAGVWDREVQRIATPGRCDHCQ